jgi:4-hydroxyphenylpyruvate dioxygenase-like putative hemolysin
VNVPLAQNVNRIDHVVMMVRPDNLDACVERLSGVLGVDFEHFVFEPQQLRGAISLEAGLEVITPLSEDSVLARQLDKWGEGIHSITFGVKDADEARARAEANGMETYGVYDALGASSPDFIAEQFQVLRECHFKQKIFGTLFVASQIEPRD